MPFKILEELYDVLSGALIILDSEDRLVTYNNIAKNLFNLPPKPPNRKFTDYISNTELQKTFSSTKKAVKKLISIDDKNYNFYRLPINKENFSGKLIYCEKIDDLALLHDEMSELKALTEELDSIFQASYDYIFVTDAKGNVKKINESYSRITGYTEKEIVGNNIFDLAQKGYFDRAATIDVIKSGKTETFTQTLKSGKTVLVTGNPLFSKKGKLIGVVTNGRDITELNRLKQEVIRAKGLSQHFQKEILRFQFDGNEEDYIVASSKMEEVSDLVQRVAKVDSTVLVVGESGVGKEIVAREIHRHSLRNEEPYICVNCAAIPESLLESELFGYESGSFTGASKQGKMGIFQLADGGTLFLDEIGELPFYLQAKLLRVIQEKEIVRIGGVKPIPIDVRLITATNRDLWKMVDERQFREDLYYRLNVVQVRIPPLRERKEEIPVYVDYFLGLLNKKYKLNRQLNPELIEVLTDYEWPGNIRELRNALEQAYVTSAEAFITNIKLGPEQESYSSIESHDKEDFEDLSLKDTLQEYEKRIIKAALSKHTTTRKAATALGVSQATIWRKAKQYGIGVHEENGS